MMKKMLEIIMVTVIVAGVVGAYFKWMGALPISVTSTQKTSTFDVSGEGKVVVVPDQAVLSLGVREEGYNLKQVQERVNAKMASLSKELKTLGIEEKDIKTTGYNYYPDYQDTNRYSAHASLEVVVRELEQVSPALDLIGQIGLDSVSGPIFGLSDELSDKTVKEARKLAIEEAEKKAEELAGLSGMRLGRIVNVVEGNMGRPVPMYSQAEVMMDKAGGEMTPTPVEAGSSEVVVSVTLSYETR